MPRRIVAVVIALTLPVFSAALAEEPASKYDNLQRMLEQKFAPRARSLAPAAAPPAEREDYQWIKPKEEESDQPAALEGQKRSSSTSWFGPLYAYVFGDTDTSATSSDTLTSSNSLEAGALRPGTTLKQALKRPSTPADATEQDVAQAEVPVAKKNSFVIQLKPTASEDEVNALLSKYSLEITKTIPALGVITVQSYAAGGEASAAAPEPAGDAKTNLRNILEPPLIRQIRQEGIVDGAFVNSTLGTKRVPKPSSAKLTVGSETHTWRWHRDDGLDGNWGLKAIRMPAVWNILDRYRHENAGLKRPKIGIVDGGFVENPSVKFGSMIGLRPFSFHAASCETHHGMHVAGIIGARNSEGTGIDGMIPDARMDAVAVDAKIIGDSSEVGVNERWEEQAVLFDDVLAKTLEYVVADTVKPDKLRVVNISLGYNFLAKALLGDTEPADVPGLALHILHQSNLIRLMAGLVEKEVLFVVAAGNDSEGRATTVDARWASPFAWAGTQESSAGPRPKNILVVEAIGRDGARPAFSNTGGHVAAPGVDIMSTLAGGRDALGVCSGTSQAAPFVSGLAGILFELDPGKTPAEVADIIRKSATASKEGTLGAAAIDALEAAAQLSPVTLRLAADLDGDGKVGQPDLAIFSRQLAALDAAATTNAAFTEDLNGDGTIDDNECYWPAIDFNGSGQGAATMKDARTLSGSRRADIDALGLTWTDSSQPYEAALSASGLALRAGEALAAASSTSVSAPPAQCRNLAAATGLVSAAAAAGSSSTTRSVPGDTVLAEAGVAAEAAPPGETSDPAKVKEEVEKAIEALRREHPKLKVTINPATGLPSSMSGFTRSPSASSLSATSEKGELSEAETLEAVKSYFGMGGLRSAFPTKNQQAEPTYLGRRRDPDFPDRYIADVEQRVNGLLVFGSSAKLTVEHSLGVTKYMGTTSNVAIENTTPKITESDAQAAARAKLEELLRRSPDPSSAFPLGTGTQVAEEKPELLVFDPALVGESKKGPTRLAFMVRIDAYRIFVDAHTGEAFFSYKDQPYAMVRRIFDLAETRVFPGTKSIDEEARERREGLTPEIMLAFRNAGLVRDYFFLVFGRDGYDDSDGAGPLTGSPLETYVRFGGKDAAHWCTSRSSVCPKGNVMVYGSGFASAIDIVAHEMTHGVLGSEKNALTYLNESGAVNESLADIFGTLIEFEAKGDGGNWLIGESAPGLSFTEPLRSMSDPNLRDAGGKPMFDRNRPYSLSNRGQPDHYVEVLTRDDELCATTVMADNGCVHFNSGILNKFAYLISEGGSHHGVPVNGIGRVKLARIAYRAMTAGLNRSSGLKATATAFVQACFELAEGSIAGIATADCDQVLAAQRATGLVIEGS